MAKLIDWIDSRFGIKDPHRKFLQRPLPPNLNYSYCLGGIAFALFLIAVITGRFLPMYYVPSETKAFRSIVKINEEVRFGWLVRSGAVAIPLLAVLILIFMPFIDSGRYGRLKAVIAGLILLLTFIIFTLMPAFSG